MKKKPSRFEKELATKIKRRAKEKSVEGTLFSFALFGIVGWSIAIPAILFALLGRFIDAKAGGGYTFTLPLIVLGIVAGSFNAWRFISKEIEK
jgi:ATP synthase protein I